MQVESISPTNVVKSGKLTPLMQQYWDVKLAHHDKIVLFRMGDFYEMFHHDAETAAPVLGIALTARNKKSADETPMCGVPHHSVAGSINKLLANGFKVAICDQIEDPKFAKGLVKRAVTRILSPGVVFDPDTIDGLRANYVASFDERSVSFLDATTGEAFYFSVKDSHRRERLLRNLQPVEIVIPERFRSSVPSGGTFDPLITIHEDLGTAVAGSPESARRLVGYVTHMQGSAVLETISPFERRELLDRMEISQTVVRHLELFETYKGEAKGALFHAINRCKTAPGSRLLRAWLQFPLAHEDAIEQRHDRVAFWRDRPANLKSVRTALASLGDVQRRLAKVGNPSVNPRDLLSLSDSLKAGLEVCGIADDSTWDPRGLSTCEKIVSTIDQTLNDDPPLQLKNGGVIRKGVNAELDSLIDLSTNSHDLIMKLEARERELTGIPSLKIRFNNVFGYYIEITHTHRDKVPKDRFERKQTLANAERYLTPELADLESKVLTAQAKRIELESEIFANLVKLCLKEARQLLILASRWAEIDVVSGLAHLALEQGYCRPKVVANGNLRLIASRHPVVEQTLDLPFVANDIVLGRGGCLLLTGPNMAGKSTLMRQIAIAALLAQAGSFVPAQDAELPLFDRLFTRIGASDFLSEGFSTFMVEMKETAEILQEAGENSLIVLDEIGRGTSTYDGMSLAQAILEFILENRKAMTLFATHYHELTEMASSYPDLHNAHMRIHESRDGSVTTSGSDITFLHTLAPGPANKSYGIHVGRLAGLPATVTRRAAQILKNLESETRVETKQMTLFGPIDRDRDESDSSPENLDETAPASSSPRSDSLNTTSRVATEVERQIVKQIAETEIPSLTPLEALNLIARWQQELS